MCSARKIRAIRAAEAVHSREEADFSPAAAEDFSPAAAAAVTLVVAEASAAVVVAAVEDSASKFADYSGREIRGGRPRASSPHPTIAPTTWSSPARPILS